MYRDDLLSRVMCMMFLLGFLSMMYTFLSSKSAEHLLSQTCRLRGMSFFKLGKCVLVVLRWGECPDKVNLYGINI